MEIRPLASWSEYRACEAVQREVWGASFTELAPASLLKIAQSVGGVTSGAFAGGETLVGFVYGLTGLEEGRPVHWSHMLAVREGHRGKGLGRALKRHQREQLMATGIEKCYWTYDPIMSSNAHLNLNHLLANVDRYVVDMYGDTGSHLHEGLGTDRFVVVWRLGPEDPDPFDPSDRDRVRREADLGRYAAVPVANPGAEEGGPLPGEAAVRVAIPSDVLAVRREDPELARRWRRSSRRAFLHYLAEGYRVAGYAPPSPGALEGHYVLIGGGPA